MHRLMFAVLAGVPSLALAAPLLSGDAEVSASWSLVVEDADPPFAPGEAVRLALGPSVGLTCPGALGGECVDIGSARLVQTVTAHADGTATFHVPVPLSVPVGSTLYAQAVVIRGVGGGESLVSNRVSALVVERLGSPRLPAVSCLEILDAGASLGDGDYWLDPEGDGSAFLATCDMTTDGGGWTMFHHITTPIPGFVRDDYLAMSTYRDGVRAAGNRLGCKPDDTTAMLRISGPGVQPWSIAARQPTPTDGGCPTTDATYFSVTGMEVPVEEINATLDTSNWALGIHSTSDAYGTEPDICMTSDLDCRSLLQVWGGNGSVIDGVLYAGRPGCGAPFDQGLKVVPFQEAAVGACEYTDALGYRASCGWYAYAIANTTDLSAHASCNNVPGGLTWSRIAAYYR